MKEGKKGEKKEGKKEVSGKEGKRREGRMEGRNVSTLAFPGFLQSLEAFFPTSYAFMLSAKIYVLYLLSV